MRQLKFRVWSKEFEKFLTKEEWFFDFDGDLYFLDIVENDMIRVPENEYIIQQYTGLKDKNGVDIYEGDILERIGNGSFCKIVIYWDDHHCAFYSKNSFNLHGRGSPIHEHNLNISDWTYWVVRGNIFENSELLKA